MRKTSLKDASLIARAQISSLVELGGNRCPECCEENQKIGTWK